MTTGGIFHERQPAALSDGVATAIDTVRVQGLGLAFGVSGLGLGLAFGVSGLERLTRALPRGSGEPGRPVRDI